MVRSTALFSFLSLYSDRQAMKVCRKILEGLKKSPEQDFEKQFVRLSFKTWSKNSSSNGDLRVSHKIWKAPRQLNMAAWMEFHQKSSEEEFLTVLWAKVIGISEEAIAGGMDISAGTVSYRLGRGIRLLGELSAEGFDGGR
jgi:hypothetical protein